MQQLSPQTSKAVLLRQTTQKQILLDQLRKTPIIEAACSKVDVGRATFYRWKTDDPTFAKAAEEALREGRARVSDLAESQLLSGIKDGDFGAVTFWLRHHHEAYAAKLKVDLESAKQEDALTPAQQKLVLEALERADLTIKPDTRAKQRSNNTQDPR